MLPLQESDNFTAIQIKFVFPQSLTFPLFSILTVALIYTKLSVYFYVDWQWILSPMIIFFMIKCFTSIILIRSYTQKFKKDTQNHSKIQMLWAVCQFFISISLSVAFLIAGQIIQNEHNYRENYITSNQMDPNRHIDNLQYLTMLIIFSLVIYLGYSIAAKKQILKEESNWAGSTITNVLLSTMGNSFSICAGGACNSFYFSTLSAFFSAFGIPITKYIHYLNYLCLFLLAFALFSLYSVKRSIKYGPFLITLLGVILILIDMFIYDYNILNYVGNVLIIVSAFWNSKLNKFRFGSKKK